MSNKKLKIAVVCMVNDSQEYLSEFIFYHLNLVDHIFLVDHNSERDLRNLSIQNITFIRSSQEAQFQSECTNTVINHFNLKNKFDWLFVLDIDEFLPFKNKSVFHEFLRKHHKAKTLQFFWKNGVPFSKEQKDMPDGLIDCHDIRFFFKNSVNYKTAVNIKRLKGNFVVPTGAHRIDYKSRIFFSLNPFRRKYIRHSFAVSQYPLLHIVAFNKDFFIKKIKIYVEQMKYRKHIKGQGGWIVKDYPKSYFGDEWLWYIANFRVTNPANFFEVKSGNFIQEKIFEHMDRNKISAMRKKILSFPLVKKIKASKAEKEYLLHKIDDSDIINNIKWFYVNEYNEIIISPPSNS
jgi:hypothetical protein